MTRREAKDTVLQGPERTKESHDFGDQEGIWKLLTRRYRATQRDEHCVHSF